MATAQEPILASFIELPSSDSLLLDGLIFKAHAGNFTPAEFQPSDTALVGIGGASNYTPNAIFGWRYDSVWTEFAVGKGATGDAGSNGTNGTNGRNGSPFTKTKSSDQSFTSDTTWYDVTDLQHDVYSGRNYFAHCIVITSAAATISGNQLALSMTGPAKNHFACQVWSPQASVSSYGIVSQIDYDGNTTSFSAPTTSASGYMQEVFAVVKPSADGVLKLRAYRSTATNHPKILTGSIFRLYDLGT